MIINTISHTVARRDREQFDRATWLHKATELPKEEFKR
jgi:hypothetical protein